MHTDVLHVAGACMSVEAVQEQLVAEGKSMLAAFAQAARDMPAYGQYAGALDTALVALYADINNAKVACRRIRCVAPKGRHK